MSVEEQVAKNTSDIIKLIEVIRRVGAFIELDTTEILADVGLTAQRNYRLVAYNKRGQGIVCHKDKCHEVYLRPKGDQAVLGNEVTVEEIDDYVSEGVFQQVDMSLSLVEIVEWLKRNHQTRRWVQFTLI